jgi:hypothetical protein
MMPRTNACASLAVVAAMLFLNCCSAFAWEADVHFGLTKWLALQVGFSKDQAEWIAHGNQGVDDSLFTDPLKVTAVSACIPGYSDPVGSILIHNNHFASQKDTPNLPANRVVKAGSIWQDGQPRLPPHVDGSEATFLTLGRFLHAFQDTWSHQGEPDIPLKCKKEWAFGHPMARGGWLCHNADLTYIWQGRDVPEMARVTYDILASALARPPLTDWKTLEPRVHDFAIAASKRAKDAWFKKEKFFDGPRDREFLKDISLPDCEPNTPCDPNIFQILFDEWREAVRERWNEVTVKTVVFPNVPDAVFRLFEDFFGKLTRQENLSELIDVESVERAYSEALHVEGSCPQLYRNVAQFMVGRPFLDGRGAHQPESLCEAVASGAQPQRAGTNCDEAVAAARRGVEIAPPRGPGLRAMQELITPERPYVYSVVPGPDQDGYSAFGRFIHLPNDILWLTARITTGGPKVTRIMWTPSE